MQTMTRQATLVVVGNLAQALEAVISHRIYSARAVVSDPQGAHIGDEPTALTRVTLDGDRYNEVIASWLNEPSQPVQPGTLLRVRWS